MKSRVFQQLAATIALAYFAVLGYIVFFARRRKFPVAEENRINLVPFKKNMALLEKHLALTHENLYYFYPDLAGNFLLFLPFPFCTFLLTGIRNRRFLLLLAFLTSFSIECIQYILHIGVADIDDILLNTLGALTGTLFVKKMASKK